MESFTFREKRSDTFVEKRGAFIVRDAFPCRQKIYIACKDWSPLFIERIHAFL